MIKIYDLFEIINIKTYLKELKNMILKFLIREEEYEYKSLRESYHIIE